MGGTSLSLPSLPTPQAQQQTSALCQGKGLTQVLLLVCSSSFGSLFHLKEGVGGEGWAFNETLALRSSGKRELWTLE